MKTLWQQQGKNFGADWFFDFTAAEDRTYDIPLIPYDILSNIAQVHVLDEAGLLSGNDKEVLISDLQGIFKQWEKGEFSLTDADEDVHSATERALTEAAGDTGKKIHAGRSRNDLVLSDIRLYTKVMLQSVVSEWIQVINILKKNAEEQKGIYFPGYTHTQAAMPNSSDAWYVGFLEVMIIGVDSLLQAYDFIDSSPLGSAAGFGVPHLKMNRSLYAGLLGFSRIQYAVTSVQLSRGIQEQKIIEALNTAAQVYNRLAADVVSYVGSDKKFIDLSNDQVSGSSVMPQKRNPDAWELIRAESHRYASWIHELQLITGNMISGYHRDLQLIKKILMDALTHMSKLNNAVIHALQGVSFNKENCGKALTPDLFATHIANSLTLNGMPFREAYRKAGSLYKTEPIPDVKTLASVYHHQCDPNHFDPKINDYDNWLDAEQSKWERVTNNLLK